MARTLRGSFLWRNRVLLTGAAMLLLAINIFFTGNRPGARAAKPSLALLWTLRPFQNSAAELASDAQGFFHDYLDLVNVRQQNDALKREVAELEAEHTRMVELQVENRHLADLLELREALGMSAVAARVIGVDPSGISRTLIISGGSDSGLQREDAVISTEGVVGKLIAVGPDSSRVLLIDDHNSGLDAFDQRSRARGIVTGELDAGMTMKYVDRTEDVRPGDAIVTSGMDGNFPGGLLIGTISQVSQEGPGLFLNVAVRPAVNFRELEQVLILTQKPAPAAGQS
jgi:rod shape-determining protein MreC